MGGAAAGVFYGAGVVGLGVLAGKKAVSRAIGWWNSSSEEVTEASLSKFSTFDLVGKWCRSGSIKISRCEDRISRIVTTLCN
jgi:hypothetical protein